MIVVLSPEELAGGGPLGVTVGVFDGVHVGHADVFAALRAGAGGEMRTLGVTLDPHPLEVLRPEIAPKLLSTAEERARLIAALPGAPDALLIRGFDRDTAGLSPGEFLRSLLPSDAELKLLVIGYDFRMGRDRSGGFDELCEIGARRGFDVVRVPATMDGGEPVSSSRVRSHLQAGDLREANRLSGHPYPVQGTVRSGRGIGSGLQFPTANVDVGDVRKLLPEFGVYAAQVAILPDPRPLPAVLNWGKRPTFGPSESVLEVHLLDFEGDLTGHELEVRFVDRIREERQFDGPEALREQIARDVTEARERLQEGSESPGRPGNPLSGLGPSDSFPG